MVDLGIYVIIDGSGSMSGVKHDVVKGINEFIKEQQDDLASTNDTVHFSLTAFDGNVSQVYIKEDLDLVAPVTVKDTFLGGGTALLDAIGRTLTKAEDDAGYRNLVVIYTDGEENQSREFTKDQIEELVTKLTDTGNWQFIYLGAEFADFHKEGAQAAMAGAAAGGTYSSLNTGKQHTNSVFKNLSKGASYYRSATMDTAADIQARGIVASSADAGVDWDAVEEKDKGKTPTL